MVLRRIDKEYFPLEEVVAEWQLPKFDLLYLVETGGLGVGDFITINRTLGLECDQSSEKFSFRSMSVDAVGGGRAVAVLCGDVAL